LNKQDEKKFYTGMVLLGLLMRGGKKLRNLINNYKDKTND